MAKSFIGLSEKELEAIINDYYGGVVNARNLPVNLYNATVAKIKEGVFAGFGAPEEEFVDSGPEKELLAYFNNNVQMFSAAKTYQEAKDTTKALFDADGFKRSFSDFRADAHKISGIYNDTWLKTEFDTAANMGFSSRQWLDATRDAEFLPLLRYQTAGDERVRPEHVALDDIVRPVKSAFWNTHFPPNGWRCRCLAEQLPEGEEPETPDKDLPPSYRVPPLFRMNPGKDKFIFNPGNKNSKGHPYFTVNKADEDFKKRNFGLPLTPPPTATPKSANEPFKPANFDEEIGADMGANFWPLLKMPTDLNIDRTRGSAHLMTRISGVIAHSRVRINTKRHNTDVLKKGIIAHEFGHAIHWQNNWIARPAFQFDDLIVHPEIEKVFRKWEKKTGKGAPAKKRDLIRGKLWIKTDNVAFNEILEKLGPKKKDDPSGLKKLKWEREAPEHWNKMMDTLGALTRNAVGWGHPKSYLMSDKGYGARAEFFAHASENYFAGNPVFEEVFPEMYDDMKEMMNTLIKESKGKPPPPPDPGGF